MTLGWISGESDILSPKYRNLTCATATADLNQPLGTPTALRVHRFPGANHLG